MSKKIKFTTIITGLGILATIGFLAPAQSGQEVAATKYPANTDTLESPFVIMSVQPSTSKITVKYNGEKGNFQPLSLINIEAINIERGATEDQIDKAIPSMGKATPYWNYLIYYEQTYDYDERLDYGPTEKEITKSRYARTIDLDRETLHILYYSVRPGSFTSEKYIYGKINYSLCMKSAVYKPGVECRATPNPKGGIWYWPYYNGEKLPLPRDEWEAWGYSEPEPEPQPQPEPAPVPTPEPIPGSTPTSTEPTNMPGYQGGAGQNNAQGNTNKYQLVKAGVVTTQANQEQEQSDEPYSNGSADEPVRQTIEVPVAGGQTCEQGWMTRYWWVILILALGVEGVLIWWWCRRRWVKKV